MRIRVELCWHGHNRFSFRLTLPWGDREYIEGETWTRETARRALDLLESAYRLPRRNVRFRVH
jgi:hypothetical protein